MTRGTNLFLKRILPSKLPTNLEVSISLVITSPQLIFETPFPLNALENNKQNGKNVVSTQLAVSAKNNPSTKVKKPLFEWPYKIDGYSNYQVIQPP